MVTQALLLVSALSGMVAAVALLTRAASVGLVASAVFGMALVGAVSTTLVSWATG